MRPNRVSLAIAAAFGGLAQPVPLAPLCVGWSAPNYAFRRVLRCAHLGLRLPEVIYRKGE